MEARRPTLLPTPDTLRGRIADVALKLLGSANAAELLKFLTARKIADELSGTEESSVRSALDPSGGKTMSRPYLASLMLERMQAQLRIERLANRDGYLQAAEAVAGGAGLEGVSPAVLGDMRDYVVDEKADDETRARERMYYLALALVDNEAGIKEQLAASYHEFMETYAPAYEAFLAATTRRIAPDTSEQALRHSLSALLEGFAAQRRFIADIPEETVVDAVIRLFAAYTVASGEATHSLEEEVFGRPARVDGHRGPVDGLVHHTGESLYGAAIDAVQSLDDPDATVSICSLHGHRGRRHGARSEHADRLREAVEEHVGRGGRLNRVATYLSHEQLDRDLRELEDLCARFPDARVELRALVIDTPPVLAPLIAGNGIAFLARDDHHYQGVNGGIELRGAHGLKMCELAFHDLWHDRRAEWAWTEAGPYTEGISRTRELLQARSR